MKIESVVANMTQYCHGKSVKWKRSRNEKGQLEKATRAFLFLTYEILNCFQSTQNNILLSKLKLVFMKNLGVVPGKAAKLEKMG